MIARLFAALCITATLVVTAPFAADATPAPFSPAQLAAAIEQRADKTSFADLEAFAARADQAGGRESLRRLQHVSLIMMNQSEFAKFEHWNALLARRADALGDHRYQIIARLNELMARYYRGDVSVGDEIASVARTEPDWYAQVDAMSLEATLLINQNQSGAALKLLAQAEDLIPDGDPDAASAESTVWDAIGVALMDLDDLQASAKAFQRADFEFADPAYPRPDFDSVYNMAHLAVQLGDGPLARRLAAIHHRLAVRSDLPHLTPWDQNLCAMVAESFGAPSEVTRCLQGLDAKLTGAEFLAPRLLPMRAIAEARLGDVDAAAADLARFRALKASHQFDPSVFEREDQMQAELWLAQGRPAQAYALLRAYEQAHAATNAREFSGGVRQIADSLQTQLETARRNADLQGAAVRAQRWISGFIALLVFGAVAMVFWQRRGARRLRAAQLRAEAASRSKSEFLANMSHEIRTPLNGVVGVADLLLAAPLGERERRMAQIIHDSGQSLERLLSDVLDLARVEAGQLTIEAAPFHAGELVRAVAQLSRPRAEAKGLTLETRIDPALEAWFLGDAVRVRQILVNLVSNAVKFTEAGGVVLTAEAREPGVFRFTVADTGIGFDAAQKERLFGRFQQADGSITRRFGGTGLGLAISRQLASLMGGVLDCESTPGSGARFWFEGPLAACAAPSAPAEAAGALAEAGDRPIRVLVADDHDTNRTVVRMMLEQFGVECVCVNDGAQAIEALRREPFDVVLMDIQMPVMDGLEATRVIRRQEAARGVARTPILMLSANASLEHREAGRAAGADGHLSKPITAASLQRALSAVLDDEGEAREVA